MEVRFNNHFKSEMNRNLATFPLHIANGSPNQGLVGQDK
ncbi:hypothetical protein J2S10_003276 [Neobacillus ginsengisoli]|uniref:Uncharacterized protein n=1 Tax=Neobacillus ginsengisoli TaxID=904295 RepID=A0ABT9XX14_9BACI|nr:hypothetical protein [Neobacillus ginsengisoli]